jgi:acyl-CoA synthetase (AMP-forming)/AMP-acid ligase II
MSLRADDVAVPGHSLIEAFIAAAARRPHAILSVSSHRRPSGDTLACIVAEGRLVGTHLRRLGIQPGDVVAVQLPAWREWLIACVAVAHAGGVLLPIVSIYGPKELGFVLRQSRARLLITPDRWRSAEYAGILAQCGRLPDMVAHVVVGEASAGPLAWGELNVEMPIMEAAPRGADDLALLIYTSGTTADPKGVCHSSRTLLAETATFAHLSRERGVEEITLSPWPPGHIAGTCQFLRFLVDGATMVAMDQWDASEAALLVQQYRITTSSGTPFHLTGLLDAAERDGRDVSSLRFYTVGAAPVPPTLIARCAARGLATFRSYGSTEHPTVSVGDPRDPLEKRLTTEGHLMHGVELRFVDDDGHDVAVGEDGEIASRGPELFLGYFDSSLNKTAFLPGGWYRTGDIGRLDADGYLLVTDRKKDIIIRGGENISSREVEDILLSHPHITEAAVVAAADARLGEVVLAYVVLSPGASISLAAIQEHFAAAGVAKQKTPERLVVLEVMPRNATGKILKHVLRQGG